MQNSKCPFLGGGGGVKSEKVGGETVVTNMQEC